MSRGISRRAVLAGASVFATGLVLPGQAGAAAPDLIVPPLIGQHRTLPGGRRYWLSGSGAALVIGLHGSNLTAANVNAGIWNTGVAATTGWQQHAATRGYRLALAEALPGGSWNVGGGWPSGLQNDLAYLLELVADAGPVGEAYVAGFSAGGAMAWRAAAERPDVFAACGVGSGWASAQPASPIDCWWTHGGGDTTVPVRGGFVAVFPFTFPPAYLASSTAPRGSRVVQEFLPTMGHATPGWLADRWWHFWTEGR